MGEILGTKKAENDKIILEILMDYEESLQLKGHTKNIYAFSEDTADIKTNLSQRGKNEATKYFLIPRELRNNLKFNKRVKCQKFETDKKVIFIYVVDRV